MLTWLSYPRSLSETFVTWYVLFAGSSLVTREGHVRYEKSNKIIR